MADGIMTNSKRKAAKYFQNFVMRDSGMLKSSAMYKSRVVAK
jgi:hypothetical protein